jgi:predicted ATP-grasp superfamily ATP-dependent carboligase
MIALDRDVAALILKVGSYPDHHGGLEMVRSLGRAGVPVYGVFESRRVPAAFSTRLTGGFVWPTGRDTATAPRLLDALTVIASRLDRRCVVIASDDRAAVLLSEVSVKLPDTLLVPTIPPILAHGLTDKTSYAAGAARAGLPMPDDRRVRCPVPDIDGYPLPAIVKRVRRDLYPDGRWTFSTILAEDRGALARALQDESAGAYDAIVQEVLPGDDWLYHAYCDARSRTLISFTGRKLRSWPPRAGETAYARTEHNEDLKRRVDRFLLDIGHVGPIGIDFRYDRRTRVYRMLDGNPRVCASFWMFANDRGVDMVRAMHLDLTGREVPPGPQLDGRTAVIENYDLRARRSYRQRRPKADLRAWRQRDDLVPALVAGARSLVPLPLRSPDPTDGPPRYFRGRRG